MQHLILPSIFSGSVWEILAGTSAFGIFILAVLTVMSFVSWVIIFRKWREYRLAEEDGRRFLVQFRRSRQLSDSVGQAKAHSTSPFSAIYMAGVSELALINEIKNAGGAMQENVRPLDDSDFEIVEMTMEKALTEEMIRLEKSVIFLATTGNSAPFMGLLGTVVGIMDSFWAIGERGSASLAVVAPGIAEALLATIVGLGAAIPAVIAFNWANNKMKTLNDMANGFVLEFISRARREIR